MVQRMRRSFSILLLVPILHGCGGGGSGGDGATDPGASNVGGSVEVAGSSTAAGGLLRWNEYDDAFPWPATQPWANSGSADLSDDPPHHNGYDLFVQLGTTFPIRGKFHYGDFRVDLKGEKVGLWLHKVGGPAWEYAGDQVTDGDGRVEFAWPASILSGTGLWFVRMVVYGDLTTADAIVRVVSGPVQAVVTDIDGTLTTSDWELVKQTLGDFLNLHYTPRMYEDSNKVMHGLAKQGYEIVYLTARPYWLQRASRRWLQLKGFPVGPCYTYEGAIPTVGSATADAKKDRISYLQGQGATFAYAFGNATTDIDAYAAAGIPTNKTYIIGPNAGQGNTVALAKYGDLLGALVPAPNMPYRVVLVIVDGLRPDALSYYIENVADAGSPLKKTFGNGVNVKNCATTGPSITFSANASIATGRHPASHGLPGNHFLDRKTGKPVAFDGGSTYQLGQVIEVYKGEGSANKMLQVQTLYEQMSASGRYGLVDCHNFYKGAEVLQPSYTQLVTFVLNARDYDRQGTDRLLSRLDGKDNPDLITIYWPGLDHEAHGDGKIGGLQLSPVGLANLQIEYLKNVIDPELGRVRARLEQLGLLSNSVFVICSDHGHRDVVKDDDHAIDTDVFGFDPELEDVIEDSVFDDLYDKPLFLEGDFDSHAAMNGPILGITLRNRSTNQWQDAPAFEDVLSVVGSIQQHRHTGELRNSVEEILVRPAPGQPYRAVRPTRVKIHFDQVKVLDDEDWFGPGELKFKLRANGKVFQTTAVVSANDGDTIAIDKSFEFDVMPGMTLKVECEGEDEDWWFLSDSLGTATKPYGSKSALGSGPVTVESSNGDFLLTFHVEIVTLDTYVHPEMPGWGNSCPLTVLSPEYVDAQTRIEKLEHAERSGDILVFSAFRQGYYFGGKNAANHGSLYPEDSYQTFMIGGTPVVQPMTVTGASVVDIAATVAHILGIELRGKEGNSKVTTAVLPQLPN